MEESARERDPDSAEPGVEPGPETDADPLAHLDVRLESTADQVAGALREAIIDGRLEQGAFLREVPLSEQFHVSRNTIREATQILVSERLVTRQMHRGAFVSKLTAQDVRDLYRVRRVVELPGILEVSAADLEPSVRHLWQAIEEDDRAGIVSSDLDFHRAIVASMESDRLGGLFEGLQGELRLCMSLIGGSYPEPPNFARDHVAITAAVAAGDRELATALLAEHLDGAVESLAGVLEEREAAESSASG